MHRNARLCRKKLAPNLHRFSIRFHHRLIPAAQVVPAMRHLACGLNWFLLVTRTKGQLPIKSRTAL
jgi:hypothetical protein